MNIKNEQPYEDSLQSLGFKISFDVGDAYDTLPCAESDFMSIDTEESMDDDLMARIRLFSIDNDDDINKAEKAFGLIADLLKANQRSPKQKMLDLFDHNKISLGNILATNSGVYTVGHISTTVPKLTITSISSGDVVAMGQSLSELGNNFCDYFAKHRKNIPMITIWNSFNEYLDQH